MNQYPKAMIDTEAEVTTPVEAYRFLTERAREYVVELGGSVGEEALIGHIFGTTRSPQIWKTLFERVIGHDPEMRRKIDGTWTLAGVTTRTSSLLSDFVAVDVETTGLKPVSHRVIEVGIVRYLGGQQVEAYSQLVNPGRRLPAYISKLTGISDHELEQSPTFEAIAETVSTFIGDSIVVGHNVEFDLRFLNAELKRAGVPGLINESVDSMMLARAVLENIRRLSLENVAKTLGIVTKGSHRALGDAMLSAQCAQLLLQIAEDQGVASIAQLSKRRGSPALPHSRAGRARSVLDESLLVDIPRCPGVYLMRDVDDRVLYVGKAKNLKERVSSYYAQPLGYTRKMDGLVESIATIGVERTGTELEALILEAQLIRRFQPRFNRAMRAHEDYPYIRVTMSSPWPRICLARHASADGDRYFGPYRSRSATMKTVELLNDLLPLRTCRRSFKNAKSLGSPCLRLDLHQCLGPCMKKANRGDYLDAIRIATGFLEGDDEVVLSAIHEQLVEAAERQDFERARHLRNAIRTLQSISGAGRRLRQNDASRHKLLILPAYDEITVHVAIVASGRIWAKLRGSTREPKDRLEGRLSSAYQRLLINGDPEVDQTTLDDSLIVSRWIEKHSGHPGIISIDLGTTPVWRQVAEYAYSLSYGDFEGWTRPEEGQDPAECDQLDVDRQVFSIPGQYGDMAMTGSSDAATSPL
ncbi:hypothetical protein BH23CHL5_BH23CHL5_11660 [soil metagenome]